MEGGGRRVRLFIEGGQEGMDLTGAAIFEFRTRSSKVRQHFFS